MDQLYVYIQESEMTHYPNVTTTGDYAACAVAPDGSYLAATMQRNSGASYVDIWRWDAVQQLWVTAIAGQVLAPSTDFGYAGSEAPMVIGVTRNYILIADWTDTIGFISVYSPSLLPLAAYPLPTGRILASPDASKLVVTGPADVTGNSMVYVFALDLLGAPTLISTIAGVQATSAAMVSNDGHVAVITGSSVSVYTTSGALAASIPQYVTPLPLSMPLYGWITAKSIWYAPVQPGYVNINQTNPGIRWLDDGSLFLSGAYWSAAPGNLQMHANLYAAGTYAQISHVEYPADLAGNSELVNEYPIWLGTTAVQFQTEVYGDSHGQNVAQSIVQTGVQILPVVSQAQIEAGTVPTLNQTVQWAKVYLNGEIFFRFQIYGAPILPAPNQPPLRIAAPLPVIIPRRICMLTDTCCQHRIVQGKVIYAKHR